MASANLMTHLILMTHVTVLLLSCFCLNFTVQPRSERALLYVNIQGGHHIANYVLLADSVSE